MSSPSVLLYVQHLLGVGHLKRAAAVARQAAGEGLDVLLVAGGACPGDLDLGRARLCPLPPARARDTRFGALVDEQGREVDEAWRERRREALLAAFEHQRPAVLVLETFPFGRRMMRFELLPLLERAAARSPRPVIVASIRDILVRMREPAREMETVALVRRWFDHVMVHGDPAFVTLERSFPPAVEIADRLVYTGYVTEPAPAPPDPGEGSGEVIVSAGGSEVGLGLMACALEARPLTALARAPWRLLVSHQIAERGFKHLARKAPAGVIVERARRDFPALLARARLSISQSGYNTVMNLLQTGVPSVLVPFAGEDGRETEQPFRSELLAARGAAQVVSEAALDPQALARAVDAALAAPAARLEIDLGGASASGRLLAQWARAGR